MSKYPITIPFFGAEEIRAVSDVVHSGWVAQGPRVEEFETAFCQRIGANFSCATSNGTTALHLALKAVGVQPGDVVLTVSHSFIASANAVRYCLAEPVFVDISSDTYNMDAVALNRVLTEQCRPCDGNWWYTNVEQIAVGESPLRFIRNPLGRVSAILAVHQMGFPCDITAILEVAHHFGLPVVEDAACAIGSEVAVNANGSREKIGKPHGDIACFSFHPRKVVTTGEGGMLTTNNPEFDRLFRLWRSHGMTLSAAARDSASSIVFEACETTGYNYRLSDILAGLGLEQLRRIDELLEQRRYLAARYIAGLSSIEWVSLANHDSHQLPNWQSFPIYLQASAPIDQVGLMQYLLDKGISTRRGIMNAHQEPPYSAQHWSLPNSEKARDQTIMLPLYQQLDENGIDYIVDCLTKAHNA